MSSQESVDVVVVGAGFAGLPAAKAYIQCAPQANLVILDRNKTIGGTWCKERLYDGLRTNNLRGTFELADYPFHDGLGVAHGEHIPGPALHQYITEYARHWNVYHRIRFESTVLEAEKVDSDKGSGWLLTVETPDRQYTLRTEKLIVATGLTSQPQPMHIKGEETFGAPMINVSHLANDAPAIVSNPEIQRVTIFGGFKSAYDAVYMMAHAGKEVDWVIRKSGHGPTWMAPSHIVLGPLGKFWLESLVTRRFLTWFSPCIWAGQDGSGWWRSLLHQTWLGRKVVDSFWWKMSMDTLEQAGYYDDPKLKALIPDCSLFEMGTGLAVLNYPSDVLDYVRSGQVKVHRQDLARLSDHTVHLADGTSLDSDAVIASSGWLFAPAVDFKPASLHADLGIPSTEYSAEQKAFWEDLDRRADVELFAQFPKLANVKYPPRIDDDLKENPLDEVDASEPRKEFQPCRLHRFTVSPGLAAKGDRSLAFAGLHASVSSHSRSEVMGLWIWAFMNDRLTVDPCRDVKDVYWEAALFNRFCFRRHSYGFGRRFPDYVFDAIPFNDLLLNDLGISGMRKGGSLYRELFEPYTKLDYRGITAEWLEKRNKTEDKKLC